MTQTNFEMTKFTCKMSCATHDPLWLISRLNTVRFILPGQYMYTSWCTQSWLRHKIIGAVMGTVCKTNGHVNRPSDIKKQKLCEIFWQDYAIRTSYYKINYAFLLSYFRFILLGFRRKKKHNSLGCSKDKVKHLRTNCGQKRLEVLAHHGFPTMDFQPWSIKILHLQPIIHIEGVPSCSIFCS